MIADPTTETLLGELIALLGEAYLDSRRQADERHAAALRARKRAIRDRGPVVVLTARKGCGTLLAWLLHRALGERPCRSCVHAAAARWAEQAVRELREAG